LLLTDGQDTGLALSWNRESAEAKLDATRLTFEDVARAASAAGTELYAISTQTRPKVMTDAWLASRSSTIVTQRTRGLGVPHYTAYLAELVRLAGGKLLFLRELGSLADVYQHIAAGLRAQYTLGYYPASGRRSRGWHTLKLEVRGRPELRVEHRQTYYRPGEAGEPSH
jgi:VWFA-related protein